MIDVCDDCEYSIVIADLIESLAKLEMFTLNVWTNMRDLPFVFENHCDFLFLQEGIRIEDDRGIYYVPYDGIEYIRVDKS